MLVCRLKLIASVLAFHFVVPLAAQQQGHTNQANWELYDRFAPEALDRFAHSTSVDPNWIEETDAFWYVWRDDSGKRFTLVTTSPPAKRPLFDHQVLSELLSAELGRYFEAQSLPITDLEVREQGMRVAFSVDRDRFEFDVTRQRLTPLDRESTPRQWRRFSPDSTAYVYAEDHDLYYVEVVDGADQEPVRLTSDGEEHYSFGRRSRSEEREIGPDRRVRSGAVWSDDSRAFYIRRTDRRHVAHLYLVDVLAEPRPELHSYPFPMPGESDIPRTELHVFHRDDRVLREMDVERWPTQSILDIHWVRGTSDALRLLRRARSRRVVELIELDVETGRVQSLLIESSDSGRILYEHPLYVDADNSGDFLWYSRRTGWAHLYRYSHEGTLRNPVTRGAWNVHGSSLRNGGVLEVDGERGVVWFTGAGRESGESPNHQHLYRARLDGSQSVLLDSGDADHRSVLSPTRRFLVNNYSRVDLPARAVVRDDRGSEVLALEEVEVSQLERLGWRTPERFVVKAADGVTDIYGNIWKPFDFDPETSYPIIARVYPGPQHEGVQTTFEVSSDRQQLAQLGFVVVQIGSRGGTPLRSAAYHSHGYNNVRDYPLADTKAGIQQLAGRHSWIDASRVGIYGHSGGGLMAAAAMLVPPYNRFFSVGVASAGNHDSNLYHNGWSERNHGLTVICVPHRRSRPREVPNELVCDANSGIEYEIEVPANHEMAGYLQGRLLLQHGDMDDNVHYAGTLRLVRELILHDKRFDFIMFPGMGHRFGDEYSNYWRRLRAEYFATHLLGDSYRSADAHMRRR